MYIFLIFAVVFLIALLSLYVYKESNGYHIVKYELEDSRLNKEQIKIAFISDLHNKQYGEKNSAVLKDIENIAPDYIMLGGDMITSCLEKWSEFNDTIDFIGELSKRYPVYYGMGNHEERLRRRPEKYPDGAYEKLTALLNEIGTPIIINECVHIDEAGVDLYGLDLEHQYFRKFITRHIPDDYLEDKLGVTNKSNYSILIAHNPEHFKAYAKWGADLVLSGHVHGGIIRLPFLGGVISPALKLFPKYDGGLFIEGNSKMILSRGLGSHTIPIRVNNKAEVIEITLKRKV